MVVRLEGIQKWAPHKVNYCMYWSVVKPCRLISQHSYIKKLSWEHIIASIEYSQARVIGEGSHATPCPWSNATRELPPRACGVIEEPSVIGWTRTSTSTPSEERGERRVDGMEGGNQGERGKRERGETQKCIAPHQWIDRLWMLSSVVQKVLQIFELQRLTSCILQLSPDQHYPQQLISADISHEERKAWTDWQLTVADRPLPKWQQ